MPDELDNSTGPNDLDRLARRTAGAGVTMLCDKGEGIVSLLPSKLSAKVARELQDICSKLSSETAKIKVLDKKDERHVRDLELVGRGMLESVSVETKRELAEALVDVMRQAGYLGTDPRMGRPVSGPPPNSGVALRYKEVPAAKLRIRFGSASHTDVHLIIDGDPRKFLKGEEAFGGINLQSKTQLGLGSTSNPLEIEGTVRIDTTTRSPSLGAYIGVTWSW